MPPLVRDHPAHQPRALRRARRARRHRQLAPHRRGAVALGRRRPPSTPMGEAEAAWREQRSRRRPPRRRLERGLALGLRPGSGPAARRARRRRYAPKVRVPVSTRRAPMAAIRPAAMRTPLGLAASATRSRHGRSLLASPRALVTPSGGVLGLDELVRCARRGGRPSAAPQSWVGVVTGRTAARSRARRRARPRLRSPRAPHHRVRRWLPIGAWRGPRGRRGRLVGPGSVGGSAVASDTGTSGGGPGQRRPGGAAARRAAASRVGREAVAIEPC